MIVTIRSDQSIKVDRKDCVSMEIEGILRDLKHHEATVRKPRYFDEVMCAQPPRNAMDDVAWGFDLLTIPNEYVHPALSYRSADGSLPRIVAAKQLRLYQEYGLDPQKHLFCITGSWLYGLDDRESDYDLGVIVLDPHEKESILHAASTVNGAACLRIYLIDEVFGRLMAGDRWIWEIVSAPAHLRSHCPDRITESLEKIMSMVATKADWWPEFFFVRSARYVKRYGALLKGSPCHEPDSSIRRWKAQCGWAYKLGYYIALEAIMCRYIAAYGRFEPARAIEVLGMRQRLLEYKQGLVAMDTWIADMDKLMPPDLYTSLQDALV